MNIEITQEEAALVAALLKLYEASIPEIGFNHETGCGCAFCDVHNKAGWMSYKTFDSLKTKTNQDQ